MSTPQYRRLVEDQNRTWERMKEIQRQAEADGWTAELRANWDEAEKHLDEVSRDIERLDRASKLADEIEYREPVDARVPEEERAVAQDPDAAYEEAFFTYLRDGMDGLGREQRQILKHGAVKRADQPQGIGTPSLGGYLVPEGFRRQITEVLKAHGGLMNHANVITTATGNPLPWPTNDDTGNVGALLSENTAVPVQEVTFGENELNAYTFTSKLIKVSWQLLNDSAFDLPSFLSRKCGERLGRAFSQYLVNGTGVSQPTGLVANCSVGRTGAVSAEAAIAYEDLIELEHSVDPAYRHNGRARYVLSDGALKLIRLLKDGDDRPLWVPIPAPGFPATINGYPYTVDNSMPAPEPDARTIIFGDVFSAYVVRMVQGIQMVRLDERYADNLQSGFFAYARMDATIDDANAVKAFVHGPAAS